MFDDIIVDILNNPIVTRKVIRGRKLNISLVFITQPYLNESKKSNKILCTIFFNEYSKQMRASTNRN